MTAIEKEILQVFRELKPEQKKRSVRLYSGNQETKGAKAK